MVLVLNRNLNFSCSIIIRSHGISLLKNNLPGPVGSGVFSKLLILTHRKNTKEERALGQFTDAIGELVATLG